jgi:hypothetical protein
MPLSNKLLIVAIIIALIAGPIIFLKNPLDAAICLMSGDEWARQGRTGRYCHINMNDGGKLCSTNAGCRSDKCVIGINGVYDAYTAEGVKREITGGNLSPSFNTLLSSDIMGKCSPDNKNTCYSGEMTINEYRAIIAPVKCE